MSLDWEREVKPKIKDLLQTSDEKPLQAWLQIAELLEQSGLAWKSKEVVSSFIVHPCNRSSLPLNPLQVHKKGSAILKMGVDPALLQRSVAFEVAHDKAQRKSQLEWMKKGVEMSDGLLCPVVGKERFASVSSGHVSQFLKALQHGCKTMEPDLEAFTSNGFMQASKINDSKLSDLLQNGWQWLIVSAEAEEQLPGLPTLAQRALNLSNSVSEDQPELEQAMELANRAKHVNGVKQFQELAKSMNIGEGICEFTRLYAGGQDVPMLRFLWHIQSTHAANISLGSEFWLAVAKTTFAGDNEMPFLRVAILCTQFTANTKIIDGFSRFITTSDLNKLKSSKLAPQVKEAEQLLSSKWAESKDHPLLYGRLCQRVIVTLLNKKGREQTVYANMAEIETKYNVEKAFPQGAPITPAASTPSTSSALVSLDDLSKEKAKVGDQYVWQSHVYVVAEVKDSKVKLECKDVFGGLEDAEWVEVGNIEKGGYKVMKKDFIAPHIVPDAMLDSKCMEVVAHDEYLRAKTFSMLMDYYIAHDVSSLDISLVLPEGCVYAKKAIAKGALKLIPCTDKLTCINKICTKSHIIVEMDGENMCIQAPKAMKATKPGEYTGGVAPFWLVEVSDAGENMVLQTIHHEYANSKFIFNILTNSKKLEKNEKLVIKKSPTDSSTTTEPAAKKSRKK